MRRWLARLAARLRARRAFERMMNREMRLHLELHEDELERQGLSRKDARRQARADFGSVAAAKDDCRDARGFGRLDTLGRELRTSVRALRRAPGFVVASVASMAVGLGANLLVFSALHQLLLKPLPIASAERVAWLFAEDAGHPGDRQPLSSGEVRALASRATALSSIAVVDDSTLVREVPERYELWRGLSVTPGLFDVLQVTPVAGTTGASSGGGMLISHERWQKDFAGSAKILGSTLVFADNKHFPVVGILPPGLEFPYRRSPQIGTGSGFTPGVQDFWIVNPVRDHDWPGGLTIARLSAASRLSSWAEVAVAADSGPRTEGERRSAVAVSLRDHSLGMLAPALPVLQAFALLVLLAALANVACLQLARATRQRTEAGVRIALGATTGHLWRTNLTESMLVTLLGACAAFALAAAGRGAFANITGDNAIVADVTIVNGSTLVMLAAVTMVIAAGLAGIPALARARSTVNTLVGGAPRGASPQTSRALRALVAAQFALSLVLVAGAAALQRSLDRLLSVDAGYRTDHVVTADVLLYVPKAHQALREIYSRVRTLPGIEYFGVIHSTPLTGKWSIRDTIEIVEGPDRRTTAPMTGGFVAYDYFQAMGIDLVAGRYFREDEAFEANPRAVIINDLAADRYFPAGKAVGARLFMYGALREVVGVVRATRDVRLETAAEPQFYQPMFFDGSQIAVRVTGDPASYVEPIRATLLASDSRLIVNEVTPLGRLVAERVRERRLAARLVTVFGALVVVLAAIGLAGVIHFVALEKWRELGVRAALGATRGGLTTVIFRDAIGMVGVGLMTGAVVIAITGRSLRGLLFEGSPYEPGALALAVAAVTIVGLMAGLVPAWRAGRADPLTALRSQ